MVESCDRVIDMVDTLIDVSRIEQENAGHALRAVRPGPEGGDRGRGGVAAPRRRAQGRGPGARAARRLPCPSRATAGCCSRWCASWWTTRSSTARPAAGSCCAPAAETAAVALEVEDFGIGIAGRARAAHLREVLHGGRRHQPPRRRHRGRPLPRPRDRAPARGDGRGAQPSGRGQPVLRAPAARRPPPRRGPRVTLATAAAFVLAGVTLACGGSPRGRSSGTGRRRAASWSECRRPGSPATPTATSALAVRRRGRAAAGTGVPRRALVRRGGHPVAGGARRVAREAAIARPPRARSSRWSSPAAGWTRCSTPSSAVPKAGRRGPRGDGGHRRARPPLAGTPGLPRRGHDACAWRTSR